MQVFLQDFAQEQLVPIFSFGLPVQQQPFVVKDCSPFSVERVAPFYPCSCTSTKCRGSHGEGIRRIFGQMPRIGVSRVTPSHLQLTRRRVNQRV